MKNFQLIASGLDVGQLLNAVQRQGDSLWNQYDVRSWHEQSVHRSVDDIVLRYNTFDGREAPLGDDFIEAVCSRIEVENYPAWNQLPEAHELIHALMFRVRGLHLGRVFISRLAPGIAIPLHSDRIAPAELEFPHRKIPALYYDRYHITLSASPGVLFRCGDEQVSMAKGEAWWFKNQELHEVINNSADDRVSLVMDIHSSQECYYAPQPRKKELAP